MAKQQTRSIFEDTIDQFIAAAGGKDNLESVFNCASRLRFTVKDKNKVDIKALKKVHLSKGLNIDGNQYQLIFGPGTVNKVMDYWNKRSTPISGTTTNVHEIKQNFFVRSKKEIQQIGWKGYTINTLRSAVRGFASIFIPLIPLFIIGGFSLAVKSMIQSFDPDGYNISGSASNVFYWMFNMMGGMVFSALPIFAGYTSSKKWGGNPWFGAVIGAILISPDILNSWGQNAVGTVYVPIGGTATDWQRFLAYTSSLGESGINGIYGDNAWALVQAVTNAGQSSFIPGNTNYESLMQLTNTIANGTFGDHYIADSAQVYALFPSLAGTDADFFKGALIGYQAQVFAILLINIVAVNIEKQLKKVIPDAISLVVIPFVTVTISVFLAFMVIAPIGRVISDWIALGFTGLFKYSNFPGFGIGGALIAFLYSPLVMTGLHQGLLPIKATIMAQYGLDYTTPIEICANTAQGVCALTMLLFIRRSKENKKLISQVLSGGISGTMGITEPAIFGVNLQAKHAFIASCCAAAIGGYWVGMTQTLANTISISSWIGLVGFAPTATTHIISWWNSLPSYFHPLFVNYDNAGHAVSGMSPMGSEAIAMGISAVFAFLFTNLFSITKWGKANIYEFTQDKQQSNWANKLDKLFHKKPYKPALNTK